MQGIMHVNTVLSLFCHRGTEDILLLSKLASCLSDPLPLYSSAQAPRAEWKAC